MESKTKLVQDADTHCILPWLLGWGGGRGCVILQLVIVILMTGYISRVICDSTPALIDVTAMTLYRLTSVTGSAMFQGFVL